MVWRGAAGCGSVGLGKAWCGLAGRGEAGLGGAGIASGMVRLGTARRGVEPPRRLFRRIPTGFGLRVILDTNHAMTPFTMEVDGELVDREQLTAWLDIAGRRIGLGDWRPQRSGHYGRFEVIGMANAGDETAL